MAAPGVVADADIVPSISAGLTGQPITVPTALPAPVFADGLLLAPVGADWGELDGGDGGWLAVGALAANSAGTTRSAADAHPPTSAVTRTNPTQPRTPTPPRGLARP
ncbi:MAG: hypothetical protein ACKV2O_02095 [Acidimicrobiales bacterium]